MEEHVKRFVTKDGKERIKIYREDYADNPRYNTDEPLHCNDWSRSYSIMVADDERSGRKYTNARNLIESLLSRYGKRETIINMLVENGKHMTDGKNVCNNALVYDKSLKGWTLREYTRWFDEKECKWRDVTFYEGRKDDIDLGQLLELCLDSTIDEICYFKYWDDGVKTASYSFYNGEVWFSDEIGCDSEGIAWMEKDEFLKYSGCKEEYWKGKSLRDIEYLLDEIEAWGDNEVYGFVVEKRVRKIVNTRYPDGEHDDTEKEIVSWEETDSCWGFYGELEKSLEWILSEAGFKNEELTEE